MYKVTLISVIVAAICCQTEAGQLFFTTADSLTPSSAVTAAGTNPTLVLPARATGTLYLWAKVSPPTYNPNAQIPYVATERFNGLGVDVIETLDIAHATNFNVKNTTARWDIPNGASASPSGSFEKVGHPTLANFDRAAVTTLGLGGLTSQLNPPPPGGTAYDVDPFNVIGTDGNVYLRFASIPITLDQFGTTSVFLRTNAKTISYSPGAQNLTFFGAGDPAVNAVTNGVQSALPDATITNVPEPIALTLFGCLAGVAVRRHGRRA